MKKIKLTTQPQKPIFTSLKAEETEKLTAFSTTCLDEDTIEKVFDKSYRKFTNIDFEVTETIELKTTQVEVKAKVEIILQN